MNENDLNTPVCKGHRDQRRAVEKLEWAAAPHFTREYRTVTLGEAEARELLTAFRNAAEDSRRYQKLCADAEARDMGWLMTDALHMGAGAIEMHCDADKEQANG